MFRERLQNVADRIDGTLALSLIAKDGIPVETLANDDSLDIELLAAELMSQVRAVSQNHQELSVGEVKNFSVTTDRFVLMIGALTEDYYLLLVLHAGAGCGRARFELRRAVLLFEEDLI
jgi:predicted regulator of Ras-like GTPase activity (Roadblock/LC7/MglB family)